LSQPSYTRPAPSVGLFLSIAVFSTLVSGHEVPLPDTTSLPAQQLLEVLSPYDMGNPASPDEWQALREKISSTFDATEKMRENYSFSRSDKDFNGVSALVYTPSGFKSQENKRVLLYIHGGAYVSGSAALDSSIIVPVSHHTGMQTIAVNYRLAPEHPFPNGLNDALAVYRALLKEYAPGSIAVFGSSAGASLAVSMVLKARAEGLDLPAALGLMSPWSDLGKTGDSYYALEGIAPVLDYELTLEHPAKAYAGSRDMKTPLISPVYADYSSDFPPALIQAGTRDLFLSNCARLQRAMLAGGADAGMSLWEGMWHSFQLIPGLPESEQALVEMADFLASKMPDE
jgi:monoterpene epsilon-lactone hydrolase